MTFKERHTHTSLEESKKLMPVMIAGLGGMAGAALDAISHGNMDINDLIKPVTAWGVGGAIGGLSSLFDGENKKTEKDKKQTK